MKLRWIDTTCFEIVTDEGEVIVTDPYIDECANHPVTSDEIKKMDYILITHTHFDHIAEIDKFFELYRPKIISAQITSFQLLNHLNLSGQCMYGMGDKEIIDFGKTRFTLINGRHAIPSRASRHLVRENQLLEEWNRTLPFGEEYIGLMKDGFREFSNFYIETKNNTRILFWGGSTTYDQTQKAKDYHPDIILMQIPSNPLPSIINFIKEIGASYVIPQHHDTYYKTRNVDQMMAEYGKEIEAECLGTHFLSMKPGKWYDFNKTIILSDE